jgi:hypothetical protein
VIATSDINKKIRKVSTQRMFMSFTTKA